MKGNINPQNLSSVMEDLLQFFDLLFDIFKSLCKINPLYSQAPF